MQMPESPQGQWGQPQPGMAGPAPGQPQPNFPEELKLIGILQIVAGGMMALGGTFGFLVVVISTLGFGIFFAPFYLYALAVAILEIINGIKTVTGNPYRKKFWWFGLPIMAICSFLVGDIFSAIVGIVALVTTSKPHIQAWME